MFALRVQLLCALVFGLTRARHDGLPEVNRVLSKATDTVKDFATQARMMQQRVAQKQASARATLAAQKSAYEDKLAAQEIENEAVVAANTNIQSAIAALQQSNAGLKNDTGKLERSNAIMRDGIANLMPKIASAEEFLTESLRNTEDTGSEVLKVLDPPKPEPSLKHFLRVTREVDQDMESSPIALLELSGKVSQALRRPAETKAEGPEDMLQELESGLRSLEEAEREGETQLKAHFLAAYEVGETKHTELLDKQRALNETRLAEQGLHRDLTLAKKHLLKTRAELKRRIGGLHVFAQRADESVATALRKAANITKAHARV